MNKERDWGKKKERERGIGKGKKEFKEGNISFYSISKSSVLLCISFLYIGFQKIYFK